MVSSMVASKTCIVGGGPTGSGEHIFPASLGGLRVNNGIYCGRHNNAYGPLAAVLVGQLAFFNAQLGIRNTRTNQVRPVTLNDPNSGEAFEFSGDKLKPAGPRILSKDEKSAVIAVTSMADLPAFLVDQKVKGVDYQVTGQGEKGMYVPGQLHARVSFGGPDGLRSIGYIAQTFFAHCFPALARDAAIQPFIDYTLNGTGDHFVWWDFEAPTLTANTFPLGHRIIVGVDAALGVAYARVSLFSTLDFAMVFYKLTGTTSSESVVNDIDPLALKMPDDLVQTYFASAIAPVTPPADQTAGLATAIGNGVAEGRVALLMQRAEDHNRRLDAEALLSRLNASAIMTDKETILRDFWNAEPQRIWRLLDFCLTTLKEQQAREPWGAMLVEVLEEATERNPAAASGVTPVAKTALDIASLALTKAMLASIKDNALDLYKTEMYIGGGIGADAAVRAVLSHKFPNLNL